MHSLLATVMASSFSTGFVSVKVVRAGASEDVDRLLIHEFGHKYSGDHLSVEYHDALCRLGARLKRLAMEKPEAIRRFSMPG